MHMGLSFSVGEVQTGIDVFSVWNVCEAEVKDGKDLGSSLEFFCSIKPAHPPEA